MFRSESPCDDLLQAEHQAASAACRLSLAFGYARAGLTAISTEPVPFTRIGHRGKLFCQFP
jgi:hypothetical protein